MLPLLTRLVGAPLPRCVALTGVPGPPPTDCHPFCEGGCTHSGVHPSPRDCVACRDVVLNGQCMENCPKDTFLVRAAAAAPPAEDDGPAAGRGGAGYCRRSATVYY